MEKNWGNLEETELNTFRLRLPLETACYVGANCSGNHNGGYPINAYVNNSNSATRVTFTLQPNQPCNGTRVGDCDFIDVLQGYDQLFLVGFQVYVPNISGSIVSIRLTPRGEFQQKMPGSPNASLFRMAPLSPLTFRYAQVSTGGICTTGQSKEQNPFLNGALWCPTPSWDFFLEVAANNVGTYGFDLYRNLPTIYASYELEILPHMANATEVDVVLFFQGHVARTNKGKAPSKPVAVYV